LIAAVAAMTTAAAPTSEAFQTRISALFCQQETKGKRWPKPPVGCRHHQKPLALNFREFAAPTNLWSLVENMPTYQWVMHVLGEYREMADNDDGYRRQMLLGVVQDLEAKARNLLRQSQEPDPNKK